MTSERECIERIRHYVPTFDQDSLVKGIGDDCAVLKKDEKNCLLLTTDTLVEGVHFDLSWHPPFLLGRKCASVNLSDIAAMGGQPVSCLLSLGFPNSIPSWLDDFMSGFTSVLKENDTLLVGGDTVKSGNDLIISVAVTGEGTTEQIRYRSGAEAGDLVWVSGPLGNAAAGLELCRRRLHKPCRQADKFKQLFQAHLDPAVLVETGKILAASGMVQAMMDISDGLATDLAHICHESGIGVEIDRSSLPVDTLLKDAAAELDMDLMDLVLRGGEDYQLLFTTKSCHEQGLQQLLADKLGMKIFCIGRVVHGQGVFLVTDTERLEISYQGYDHFIKK